LGLEGQFFHPLINEPYLFHRKQRRIGKQVPAVFGGIPTVVGRAVVGGPIPEGLKLSAQGREERATLGQPIAQSQKPRKGFYQSHVTRQSRMVGAARRAVRGRVLPERSPRRGGPTLTRPPSLTHYTMERIRA